MTKAKSLDTAILKKTKIILSQKPYSDSVIEKKKKHLASLEYMINLINNLNKVKKSHGKTY
jgi:hypothetical protein